jgi:hypothetical protein
VEAVACARVQEAQIPRYQVYKETLLCYGRGLIVCLCYEGRI